MRRHQPEASASRRDFLRSAAALGLAALAAPAARAFPAHTGSAELLRNAILINGNLVPPIYPDAPLDAALEREIRSCGLTALKATIGGSNGDADATMRQLEAYDRAIAINPGLYMQIRSIADIAAAKAQNRIGIIYSFEGVAMLDGQAARIEQFRRRGVLVMQLSYNHASPFAAGVLTPQPSHGLTEAGRQAIERMNALGVTVDMSHCDDRSTLDAVAASSRPVLVTHAGCTAVHDHPRNKTDATLRAIAEKGGVVGIYELCFISAGPAQQSLRDYLAHLAHALDICGEDHVGIGSDALLTAFDTSPESMRAWDADIVSRRERGIAAPGEGRPPFVAELNRADRFGIIADALLARGYSARIVEKVLGLNFRRVFAETWT